MYFLAGAVAIIFVCVYAGSVAWRKSLTVEQRRLEDEEIAREMRTW